MKEKVQELRWVWKSIEEKGRKSLLVCTGSRALGSHTSGWKETSQLVKVAGLDLDETVIVTRSGRPGYRRLDGSDWKFSHPAVKDKVLGLLESEYTLAIFSNQNSIKGAHEGKAAAKLRQVVTSLFDEIDREARFQDKMFFLGATQKDRFRKGLGVGMWEFFETELLRERVDMEQSFFVGDAAGRDGDHSESDKAFAQAVGIRFWNEEQFLDAFPF